MRLYIRISTFLVLLLICFESCSKPRHLIPKEKMIKVLYDIQIAQAMFKNNNQDFDDFQQKDNLIQGIYSKYKISQVIFDSSLVWYSDNIEVYNQINDSVVARLKTYNDKLTAQSNIIEQYTQYDILPSSKWLGNTQPILTFSIDSSRIKKSAKKVAYNLQFDVFGKNDTLSVDGGVYYIYKDTVILVEKSITKNQHYLFMQPLHSDSLLQRVSGYIRLRNDSTCYPDFLLYNIKYEDSIRSMVNKTRQINNSKISKNNKK